MSSSASSRWSTRSDSLTQSASAARASDRILRVLHRELGGAAESGEGRAQIVREIVERFTEHADVGGVFVEEGVELTDEHGQFPAARGAHGLVRQSRRSRGSGALSRRPRASGRVARQAKQRADGYGKKKHAGTYRPKGTTQWRQQHGTLSSSASHLNQAPSTRSREAMA